MMEIIIFVIIIIVFGLICSLIPKCGIEEKIEEEKDKRSLWQRYL